jgi:hypothetical protein
MADELRPESKARPAIAALCWPARSRAISRLLLIPGRRSARGRRARHAACRKRQHLKEGRGGRPRAGFRDFSLRSPERQMGRSAR